VVERYLTRADAALPGRIEGLYLVGSVALNDFTPNQSDVDFVAVTGDRLRRAELDRLAELHSALHRELPHPAFSGIYVSWEDLKHDPTKLADVPFYLEGEFGYSDAFEANPSVWLTLRNHPLAVRGPLKPAIWYDLAVIRQWNLDNLNSYWQEWVERGSHVLGHGAVMLSDQAIAWCIPGVTRLHYTITTGDVTSKSGACRHALATLPTRWHPLLHETLALRTGERMEGRSRLARRRAALAYMQFIIDDANDLLAETSGDSSNAEL
jgi:predicted nucleotidyltransferase